MVKFCEYGCGQEAKYQFKNGKWCCSKIWERCPGMRRKNSESKKGGNHPMYGKFLSEDHKKKIGLAIKGKSHSEETKKKISEANKGRTHSEETKKKISESKLGKSSPRKGETLSKKTKLKLSIYNKKTINYWKKKYPFFSQIEEMRYNPNKPGEKEIQVHCKNHLCPNSKEQNGWFTPTYIQLYERIRQLENEDGNGGSHFYCSEKCKEQCPLFNLKFDPLKETETPYTQEEYQQFRQFVLKRDNYICQYCGGKATEIHHERSQKLEPFFALDPDLAWSCCKECHYKYGHKTGTECSTGNLAIKVC
jgi:hypothetical protein